METEMEMEMEMEKGRQNYKLLLFYKVVGVKCSRL